MHRRTMNPWGTKGISTTEIMMRLPHLDTFRRHTRIGLGPGIWWRKTEIADLWDTSVDKHVNTEIVRGPT